MDEIVPGLAVTPAYSPSGNIAGYLIVHIPSGGKWLDSFSIYHRAVEAIQELAQLGDWTKSEKSVVRFGKRRVRAILQKHQF